MLIALTVKLPAVWVVLMDVLEAVAHIHQQKPPMDSVHELNSFINFQKTCIASLSRLLLQKLEAVEQLFLHSFFPGYWEIRASLQKSHWLRSAVMLHFVEVLHVF